MLKHVSYRASSTSLARPFGNCRSSNTLGAQGKSPLSQTDIDGASSAPNSPKMSPFTRHARHRSVTPQSSPLSLSSDEVDGPKRHTIQSKMPIEGNSSLQISGTPEQNTSLLDSPSTKDGIEAQTQSPSKSEDSFSLKADDPLSKHKNDLRNADSVEVRSELMPEVSARHREAPDNISLHSTISFSSLCRNDLRASSTSLNTPKVPVRVHLRQLRPDIEYKTLRLDAEMSCRQLIEHLLQKLRLKHRDPNLFAVVLEVAVKGPAGAPPVKRRFLLEDSARPVELQQCRPRGEANFSVTMRRGGVLRVRDSVLTPGSQYKSVLVSYTSTVVEVIQLLLRCNNRSDDWRMFTLHEVCSNPYNDRLLRDDDKPLYVQNSWPKNEKQKYSLVLRRHLTQGLIENGDTWRRLSIDECSLDVDAELDEHNSTCSSILTTSSNSSRSRSSISSTTASVLSLASLSSNGSSRCSFSSNSSSGVSSGSSSSFSSAETPEKNRKVNVGKRSLPPIPRAETPVSKVYPISAEENIQSYFSMPPDEEVSDASPEKGNNSDSGKRFPPPLPRRILSYPVAKVTSTCSTKKEITVSKPFCKSWSSSCYSPITWIKARGPTAQAWQNRSRSVRIRSATISSPVEHMANLSLHNRSKSSDSYKLSLINSSSKSKVQSTETAAFHQRSASLGRAQSTSSVISSSKASDYPFIVPSSTKLRPLSLAPNSSVTFPSRPSSLLSSQSQSTSTLMASSSTLSLTSPVESKSQSFTVSIGHLDSLSPTPPPASHVHENCSIKSEKEEKPSASNSDEECQVARLQEKVSRPKCSSREDIAFSRSDSFNTNEQALMENTKHCPSCCRYDNCFYI